LKFYRALYLWGCDRSPCKQSTLNLSYLRTKNNLYTPRQVLQSFHLLGINIYESYNFETVLYLEFTYILIGSVKETLWSFSTLDVKVAEYKYAILYFATFSKISLICFSKSRFSSLSASSKTKYFILFRSKPFVF
jgi:hypothetical protein